MGLGLVRIGGVDRGDLLRRCLVCTAVCGPLMGFQIDDKNAVGWLVGWLLAWNRQNNTTQNT